MMNRVMRWSRLAMAVLITAGAAGSANAELVLASGTSVNGTVQTDMAARGLTLNLVNPSVFGTTSLAGYDAVWLGWDTTYGYDSATQTNLLNFLTAGGHVFAETPVTNILSFLPFGSEITVTGASTNNVHIVDSTSFAMKGLTDAGLSNWDFSSHGDYAYSSIGSFAGVAKDASSTDWVTLTRRVGAGYLTVTAQDPDFHIQAGRGATGSFSPKADFIVNALTGRDTTDAIATPEPSTLVSAGMAGLMGLGYAWRRRKAKPAA